MSRVSNLLCKKDCFSSHLKRMSQYLLLLIPGTLVWYKAFGDWEVQYITCERKTLHTQMMPEEISLMLDHMASMKTDWIDWIDNMNISSSRAKAMPGKGNADGCNFNLHFWLSQDKWLAMPSAMQGSSAHKLFTLQVSQKLNCSQFWPAQFYASDSLWLFN